MSLARELVACRWRGISYGKHGEVNLLILSLLGCRTVATSVFLRLPIYSGASSWRPMRFAVQSVGTVLHIVDRVAFNAQRALIFPMDADDEARGSASYGPWMAKDCAQPILGISNPLYGREGGQLTTRASDINGKVCTPLRSICSQRFCPTARCRAAVLRLCAVGSV